MTRAIEVKKTTHSSDEEGVRSRDKKVLNAFGLNEGKKQ